MVFAVHFFNAIILLVKRSKNEKSYKILNDMEVRHTHAPTLENSNKRQKSKHKYLL